MKRIISPLLTLIIAMSFIPSAYAEDSGFVFEILDINEGSSGDAYYSYVDVANLTSVMQSGVLVVASYSPDGEFLNYVYKYISLYPNTTETVFMRFESSVPSTLQKAFIWDEFGTFTPLSKAFFKKFPTAIAFKAKEYVPQSELSDNYQFHLRNQRIKFGVGQWKVGNSVDIYVNGALYTTIIPETDIDNGLTLSQAKLDAILSQAQGRIGLIRNPESRAFTEIHVDCYQVAEVTSVESNSYNTKISLQGIKGCIDANSDSANWDYILIDNDAVTSGNVTVSVTRDGAECDLSSIQPDDIIAYAVDFTSEDGLVNPKKIDIIATAETISGTVTSIDQKNPDTPSDNVYTIDGTDFALIYGDYPRQSIFDYDSLNITLDPFGRIYAYERTSEPVSFAIALTSTEDNQIKLLLSNGTTKTYEVDTTKATNFTADFVTDKIDNETCVADRIVRYEVSDENDKVTDIYKVEPTADITNEFYDASESLLGSNNTILLETPILRVDSDAEGTVGTSFANNYISLTKTDLIDKEIYFGHVYKVGSTVAFVVLTGVGTAFSESSRFAVVFDGVAPSLTADGDRVDAIEVLYEGRENTLITTPGVFDKYGLKQGDAFFFETDADGYVKSVYKVYDKTSNFIPFPDAIEDTLKTDNPDITTEEILDTMDDFLNMSDGVWSYNIWDKTADIVLAEGVVVDVTDSHISFATKTQIAKNELDTTSYIDGADGNGIIDYTFAVDCVAYVYDKNSDEKEQYKYSAIYPSSIRPSTFDSFELEDTPGVFKGTETNTLESHANNALAMIVDSEIVAIYVIQQ